MTPTETLDLRGVPCPSNSAKALIQIAMMSAGEVLEVWIDDGEPALNVPESVAGEGHRVIEKKKIDTSTWALLIEVAE